MKTFYELQEEAKLEVGNRIMLLRLAASLQARGMCAYDMREVGTHSTICFVDAGDSKHLFRVRLEAQRLKIEMCTSERADAGSGADFKLTVEQTDYIPFSATEDCLVERMKKMLESLTVPAVPVPA